MQQTNSQQLETATPPLTRELTRSLRRMTFASLPPDVVTRVVHCVLDWFGVALAGAGEPLTAILRDEAYAQGGTPRATLVGSGGGVAAMQAALINGAAGHALDYDDVHLGMSGHPTVPVLPALLALAEERGADGRALITAFVAGVEAECRLGALVMPSHYDLGFHATGTLGTYGAAAACAHLLGLDEERFQTALGIAGTQAAGLKSMFGTMCKPFHAGKAAANGLYAATLAARGFTSNPNVLETAQGLAATQTRAAHPQRMLTGLGDQYAVRDVLFKYHAACYGTHAATEGLLHLRQQHTLTPGQIREVELRVPAGALAMCNIERPATALEGKFSLRFTAAVALGGSTTGEAAFTDEAVTDPLLVSLRDRVRVVVDDTHAVARTHVTVTLTNGERLTATGDVEQPEPDLARQWSRLTTKFRGLAAPVIGEAQAARLLDAVAALDTSTTVAEVMTLATAQVVSA